MTVNAQADLEAIYATIMARATGKQVSQASHKDKSASFANASLSDLIKLYRQLWTPASGLPDLKELEATTIRRGPPARPFGRGRCP
jgi:hypothetical protein